MPGLDFTIGNSEKINCHSKKSWTGKEMLDLMVKVCNNFVSFGVRKGDVVCFFVNDVDYHAITSFGLIAVGGVYTGADYNYPVDEVIFHAIQSQSRYLVVNEDTLDVGIEVVEQIREMDMTRRVELIFLGSECDNNSLLGGISMKFLLNFGEQVESGRVMIDPEKDLALIGYSSGSTGRPKAIRKNHRSISRHVNIGAPGFEFGGIRKDVNLIKARFGHSNPLILLYVSLVSGAKSVLYDPYSGDFDSLFLKYVHEFGVTSSFLLPTTVHYISKVLTSEEVIKYDLSSLNDVTVGGSVLSSEMALDFVSKTKIKHFRQCYGSTDAGWLSINPRFRPATEVDTIGVPLPGCVIKVIDLETGERLPAGETGEICVQGPQMVLNSYMSGEANKQNFDQDAFLRMGDLGKYNEHGQLFLTGRIKQVIKCDGLQVAASELESLLMNHKNVVEAAVIGISSQERGEVPKGFVKLDAMTTSKMINLKRNEKLFIEASDALKRELLRYMATKVAPFKQLRGGLELLIESDFPRTVIGKIDKKKLS